VFGEEEYSEQFSFDEDIPVRIYDGLFLNVADFLK
jgi:hypothetical protein